MSGQSNLHVIPAGALVVLCGVSGSGKSTFAGRHFRPTQIVSSDACRAMLSDDPADQHVSGKAFELLHWIAGERLHLRRTTVVDSTALSKRARHDLLRIARSHRAPAILVCLDPGFETCLERDRQRGRSVGPEVIEQQHGSFRRAVVDAESEGWDRIVVLAGDEIEDARLAVQSGSFDLRHLAGPFDVIGDVHGCADELRELVDKLGYQVDERDRLSHPEGRMLVFLGDLGDRGPCSDVPFAWAMRWVEAGVALYTPGNHCNKLMRYLQGRNVRQTHGLALTIQQVEGRDKAERGFRQRLRRFIEEAPTYLWLDGGDLVVAHAGIKEQMIGSDGRKIQTMCLYGDVTGATNPDGTPVRLDWAEHYRGTAAIVYGHTPRSGPEWVNNTINIDQGCVFGGWLTALRWPERECVQVRAHRAYYRERTPAWLSEAVRELPRA